MGGTPGPRLGPALAACISASLAASLTPGTAHAAPAARTQGPGCPTGWASARSASSFVSGPWNPDEGRAPGRQVREEVVATACLRRSGSTATMTVSWRAVGRLYEGIVGYRLKDCTTGRAEERHSRSLQYPRGSRGTSDADRVTLTVDPTHRYAVRVTGGGSYERGAGLGGVGFFSPHPPPGVQPFATESACR